MTSQRLRAKPEALGSLLPSCRLRAHIAPLQNSFFSVCGVFFFEEKTALIFFELTAPKKVGFVQILYSRIPQRFRIVKFIEKFKTRVKNLKIEKIVAFD